MPELFLTIFFISILLLFLGSGVWVAISMIGVSSIGMLIFTSRPVGDAMATTIWGTSSSWTLTALPLFEWMGEIFTTPIINYSTYANDEGYGQQMFYVDPTMIGDTLLIYGHVNENISDYIYIILEDNE